MQTICVLLYIRLLVYHVYYCLSISVYILMYLAFLVVNTYVTRWEVFRHNLVRIFEMKTGLNGFIISGFMFCDLSYQFLFACKANSSFLWALRLLCGLLDFSAILLTVPSYFLAADIQTVYRYDIFLRHVLSHILLHIHINVGENAFLRL